MRSSLVTVGGPRQRWVLALLALLALLVLLGSPSLIAPPALAQASKLENGPPRPAEPAPEPEWNPLRAHKSLEIGRFYLKTGKYDAAISRFEEAAQFQPGLAEPFLRLGQAYEKKKDFRSAISAYRKYLELYRTAPDRKKVLKEITKLTDRIQRQARRESSQ